MPGANSYSAMSPSRPRSRPSNRENVRGMPMNESRPGVPGRPASRPSSRLSSKRNEASSWQPQTGPGSRPYSTGEVRPDF